MAESGSDHRRFPRIRAKHTVLVKSVDPPAEGFARTKVMSRGGCGFLTREPIEAGAVVDLLITVGPEVVRVTGRSIYAQPLEDGRREVGVEFLDVSEEDRRLIAEALDPSD